MNAGAVQILQAGVERSRREHKFLIWVDVGDLDSVLSELAQAKEANEILIGKLWDATKQPERPLWWCLDNEIKAEFRITLSTSGSAAQLVWLVERGQPERQEPTVWAYGPQKAGGLSWVRWTQDANEARRFATQEEAKTFITDHLMHPTRGASARAVQHGFLSQAG